MDWLLQGAELHYGEWDDDEFGVLYNATSGDTHLVQSLAIEILQMMQSGLKTTAALTTELGRAFPDVAPGSIEENVLAALYQLQRAGIVASHST